MSPKQLKSAGKSNGKPTGNAKRASTKHVHVDEFAAKAAATRVERDKLFGSLPSTQGLPTKSEGRTSSKKKVTPAERVVDENVEP